jgi:transposase InsO family protein/NTP pyrophosphatase (non-canonical NTP hydrolase)
VFVELNVVEQRLKAVLEVLDGATLSMSPVGIWSAARTVHEWLRRYAADGLKGLVDHSSRPVSCPHQIAPEVEARIVELRRAERLIGPDTILKRLRRDGVEPLPGRSSVHRCLIRHNLVVPEARKRKRADYKRWERSRSMELWRMDIVGGVMLAGGGEAKIVSGIDDNSRFIISAHVVSRATARPTCDGLEKAMRTYGMPEQILTDNGKVFTGRFGPGTGEVLFDRICRENGVKHLLTAPRSPTTTGKIERWHKTMRSEFLGGNVFDTVADAQTQLDISVRSYNEVREHQSIGNVPPIRRFELRTITAKSPRREPVQADPAGAMPAGATRRVTPGDGVARFTEERGELAETIRVFPLAPGYFLSEAADVFAWLCHLFNKWAFENKVQVPGIYLDSLFEESYPGGCSECGSALCACPPILHSTLGRIAGEIRHRVRIFQTASTRLMRFNAFSARSQPGCE